MQYAVKCPCGMRGRRTGKTAPFCLLETQAAYSAITCHLDSPSSLGASSALHLPATNRLRLDVRADLASRGEAGAAGDLVPC